MGDANAVGSAGGTPGSRFRLIDIVEDGEEKEEEGERKKA